MSKNGMVMVGAVVGALLLLPVASFADWYDNFEDGSYNQDPCDPGFFDPNLWDTDNPHWVMYPLIQNNWQATIEGGWLRLFTDNSVLATVLAAAANDFDTDPNTSITYWDDGTSHYLLTKVAYSGAPADPNDDTGRATLMIHANPATWIGLCFELDFDAALGPKDRNPHCYHANLQGGSGLTWNNFKRIWLDPNDPCTPNIDQWEREGFWMVVQFEVDPNFPNQPGDPNGKYLRGAMWSGEKYDWDGNWLLEGELSGDWWSGGPNYYTPGPGFSSVMAWSDVDYTNGFPADCAYDELEARIGVFTNVSRTLTVKMKDCSSLNLEPNLAHPDGGEKRRYTRGTPVVLDAVVPVGNKVFKKWTIKGPNDSGDPLYQIVTDTNEVVYVTMDGDYLVKATCKCGGGGIEPFAAAVLLVLGLGVIVRRVS